MISLQQVRQAYKVGKKIYEVYADPFEIKEYEVRYIDPDKPKVGEPVCCNESGYYLHIDDEGTYNIWDWDRESESICDKLYDSREKAEKRLYDMRMEYVCGIVKVIKYHLGGIEEVMGQLGYKVNE